LDCNKRLGHALAQRGIAVLRYDRRGLGKSAAAWSGKEEDFRFDILVDDLADWVKLLRKDRRFSKVGIMGHSQGSLVGFWQLRRSRWMPSCPWPVSDARRTRH
jgi:alpha-beta hydrolase superfamily lysophospholipase